MEPFEQTPEESPAFTQSTSSQEDAIPEQEDAINHAVPTAWHAVQDEVRRGSGQSEYGPSVPTSPEPNGGPLGCCFGVVVALVLSLSIAIASRLYADPLAALLHGNLSITVRLVMALFACVAAILFGYLGWKIGRRVYREYELSPKQQQRLARLQARHPQRVQRRR